MNSRKRELGNEEVGIKKRRERGYGNVQDILYLFSLESMQSDGMVCACAYIRVLCVCACACVYFARAAQRERICASPSILRNFS
jgi:hypothetical protein